jgi:hypothetical protein
LPPSVKVPANQNTASISVLSGSVTTSTTVTVSASYSGTQTTTVTVVPISGVLATTAASGITGSAAALNGTVNPRGANGQYQFQWSTDPTLSTNVQASCNVLGYGDCPTWTANSTMQSFSFPVSGLPNSATYYFRLAGYDVDNSSLWTGAILNFTTGKPPVVQTTAASGITGSAAALNGTVNPRGANGQYQFQWSTDPTLSTNVQASCNVLGYGDCPSLLGYTHETHKSCVG